MQAKLKHLIDVGLDYLRLGQPATTLSGGEAQRLKLAAYMLAQAAAAGRCSCLTSRPPGCTSRTSSSCSIVSTRCLDVGHSLVIVEHNLQLMKAADYIIDLGPGAADEGGRVVVAGTPEERGRAGRVGDGPVSRPRVRPRRGA